MVHKCLLIPEILRLICETFIDGPESKSSLVALATTSRAFQQPALDSLWSNMVDLVPLIKCMPRDLWKEKNNTSKNRKLLKLKRAIIVSDWTRFLVYGTRVRKLEFRSRNRGTDIYIDATVFEAITLATNARKLLPNLRELSWDPESDIFPYIHLFLGPKILRFNIRLDFCTGARLSLIPTLNLYPEITHVELSATSEDPHRLTAVSDAVCQWNNLRALVVEDLNDKALLHIASLPNLKELSLKPFAHRAYDVSPSFKREIGFPSLRSLGMIAPRIENCIGVIQLMSSCPLYILMIFLRNRSSAALWKTFFEAMEKHCLSATLRYVVIEEHKGLIQDLEDVIEIDDYILQFHHFKSFLHFPNVVEITLGPFHGFSLTPDVVRTIATKWRGIQKLILGTTTPSHGTPGITIDDLIPFAEYCPTLDHLGIVFDARSAKATLKKPGGGYSTHLRTLHVGDSPITDSALVAAFLSDIFPRLSVIAPLDGDRNDLGSELDTKWIDAGRMVDIFSSVRKQEQQCINN